jgi:hypothetical protein
MHTETEKLGAQGKSFFRLVLDILCEASRSVNLIEFIQEEFPESMEGDTPEAVSIDREAWQKEPI